MVVFVVVVLFVPQFVSERGDGCVANMYKEVVCTCAPNCAGVGYTGCVIVYTYTRVGIEHEANVPTIAQIARVEDILTHLRQELCNLHSRHRPEPAQDVTLRWQLLVQAQAAPITVWRGRRVSLAHATSLYHAWDAITDCSCEGCTGGEVLCTYTCFGTLSL